MKFIGRISDALKAGFRGLRQRLNAHIWMFRNPFARRRVPVATVVEGLRTRRTPVYRTPAYMRKALGWYGGNSHQRRIWRRMFMRPKEVAAV